MNRAVSIFAPLLLAALLARAKPDARPSPASPPAPAPPAGAAYCPGEYADDYAALLPKARELEQQLPAYTFCIRTVATYECPFYGADGTLRRKKRRVVAHGTGFAYRQQGGETFLLTNQHVAEWPAVTDEDHPVEDVPAGCKRVSDTLMIVDKESDSYDLDDIPLSRVVVDGPLDVAILKARAPLPVLPWRIGHSAGLKERNVVDVRGFPLGVFKATNVGKVVSAYDHDTYKDWDHDDFVVDALLSPGNSGSPVLAISCKTGEFELVGIYHAAYTRGSALNAVIGVDQIRDLMTTLKRVPHAKSETSASLDGAARARLVAASKSTLEPFFPLGNMIAAVRVRDDGVLFYELLNKDFPHRAYPILVLEDLPAADSDGFGLPGRVWVGGRRGLKLYARSELDADTQSQLARLLDGLRRDSVASYELRTADQEGSTTREKFERTERLEKALQKISAAYADLAQTAFDLSERLGPQRGDPAVTMSALLLSPPPIAEAAANPVVASPPAAATAPSAGGVSNLPPGSGSHPPQVGANPPVEGPRGMRRN
ncbi:MAG TPA: serine protease [Myxococcaceae bacterium]|nr:serine protease [Myxococcaceae bacterium]